MNAPHEDRANLDTYVIGVDYGTLSGRAVVVRVADGAELAVAEHSYTHAVAFAQARRDIPVLGTTHADTFNGPIPCTPDLTPDQCAKDYEYNTGRVIVDLLESDDRRAAEVPAALVANHGPFTWGTTPRKSLEHAIICEAVAEMAINTLALSPTAPPPPHLLARHYTRKHGPNAYYGNPAPEPAA